MREIHLNGYIDDEEWFGDEITLDALHALLYPPDAEDPDSRFPGFGTGQILCRYDFAPEFSRYSETLGYFG